MPPNINVKQPSYRECHPNTFVSRMHTHTCFSHMNSLMHATKNTHRLSLVCCSLGRGITIGIEVFFFLAIPLFSVT